MPPGDEVLKRLATTSSLPLTPTQRKVKSSMLPTTWPQIDTPMREPVFDLHLESGLNSARPARATSPAALRPTLRRRTSFDFRSTRLRMAQRRPAPTLVAASQLPLRRVAPTT